MDPLVQTEPLFETIRRRGRLDAPLLLVAFGGAAGETPAAVVEYLALQWEARPIASLDPDGLYDFTVARPNVLFDEGERVIEWPGVRFWHARPAGADRDVLLVEGREPHFHWQRVSSAVIGVARALGVSEAIVLGSYAAGVAHTRRVPVTMTGEGGAFATHAGIAPIAPRYQGPASAAMVLSVALRDAGFKTMNLNALAPFYLEVDPSPHAMAALIEVIDRGLGIQTSLETLDQHRLAVDAQALAVMRSSPAVAQLVANLERQHDESPGAPTEPTLRAADVIADIEALLAQRGRDPGGSGAGPTRQMP